MPATAALIHEQYKEDEEEENPHPYAEQMYRARLGKFFLVLRNESYINPAIADGDLRDPTVQSTLCHSFCIQVTFT